MRPLPYREKGPESAITRRHIIRVNGVERFNEMMNFNVPPSSNYADAVKLDRTITFTVPAGSFTIEHEVMPDYDSFFAGSSWIWANSRRPVAP